MELEASLLFAIPVVLGIGLLALAKWARRRNALLNSFLRTSAGMKALIRGELGEERELFGDLPAPLHTAGKVLAALAILFVLGTLLLVAILIIGRTSA